MVKLVGTTRKIFKSIYKSDNNNSLIDIDILSQTFSDLNQLEQDLRYLRDVSLIDTDYNYNYHLTTQGRNYYKLERLTIISECVRSFIFPLIVAFFTALITTLLTLWLKH